MDTINRLSSDLEKSNLILFELSKTMNWIFQNNVEEFNFNKILNKFGNIVQADRSYIFQFHEMGEDCFYQQSHEWCNEGIKPQFNNLKLQYIPCDDPCIIDVHKKMIKGDCFKSIVKNMCCDARCILEEQDIKSVAFVPIFSNKELWGFIGFDDCTYERYWSDVEMNALKALATILGAVVYKLRLIKEDRIQQEKTVAKMRTYRKRLESSVERLTTAVAQ